MENRIAKNIPSPKNEATMIALYKKQNPKACKRDGMDISRVKTKDGEIGHGLMTQKINRSHDNGYHKVYDFISDNKLKK